MFRLMPVDEYCSQPKEASFCGRQQLVRRLVTGERAKKLTIGCSALNEVSVSILHPPRLREHYERGSRKFVTARGRKSGCATPPSGHGCCTHERTVAVVLHVTCTRHSQHSSTYHRLDSAGRSTKGHEGIRGTDEGCQGGGKGTWR